MNCQACGAHNPEGVRSCLQCQRLLPPPPAPDSPRCKAHPEHAAAGPCGRCGTFYCGACLTAVGSQWLCEACQAVAGLLPWDNREANGVLAGWFKTCTALLLNPIQSLQTARPEDSLGGSLLFSLFCAVVAYAPTFVVYALFFGLAMPSKLFGGGKSSDLMAPVTVGAIFGAYGVILMVFVAASPLVFGGIQHLVLSLAGANPRSYQVSVRAAALALAPGLCGLVPVCGLYAFPVWALVLNVLAIMALHRTDGWRAFFAALSPWLICCGCPFGLGLLSGLARGAF